MYQKYLEFFLETIGECKNAKTEIFDDFLTISSNTWVVEQKLNS